MTAILLVISRTGSVSPRNASTRSLSVAISIDNSPMRFSVFVATLQPFVDRHHLAEKLLHAKVLQVVADLQQIAPNPVKAKMHVQRVVQFLGSEVRGDLAREISDRQTEESPTL